MNHIQGVSKFMTTRKSVQQQCKYLFLLVTLATFGLFGMQVLLGPSLALSDNSHMLVFFRSWAWLAFFFQEGRLRMMALGGKKHFIMSLITQRVTPFSGVAKCNKQKASSNKILFLFSGKEIAIFDQRECQSEASSPKSFLPISEERNKWYI